MQVCWNLICSLWLELFIDYGSAFVTNGKEIESKGVQFSGRDAPDKINRGGKSAVARDSSKISALMPQEHQIRMRSDEREKRFKPPWFLFFSLGQTMPFKLWLSDFWRS